MIRTVAAITAAILLLWLLSKSKWLDKILVKLINWAIGKFTKLKIKDYTELLNLTGEYEITVLTVREEDWLEGKKLKDLELKEEGINLIGIRRDDGTYVGTPHGGTRISAGDSLILYGREKTLTSLESRKEDFRGQQEHEQAVEDQERAMEVQEETEEKREKEQKR
jgi:NhaP-type Na+/H+ and K+/H+ antiporter